MLNKKRYAVITGDIVNSTSLSQEQRMILLKTLKEIFKKIEEVYPHTIESQFEIYRGDSFQGVLSDPEKALITCILIKAYLRKSFPTTLKKAWDARLALGIGEIDFLSHTGSEGDGPAFRRSGPVLDEMKGENRTMITTPWENINLEFEVSCTFLDIIISRWSSSQAEVVLELLDGFTQQQIADKLKISQVAVHHRIKNAGWNAVQKFLNRYEFVIEQNLGV